LFSKGGSAVLDAPEEKYASKSKRENAPYRRAAAVEIPRRGPGSYADDFPEDDDAPTRRKPGFRLRFNGGILPKSLWGRIAAGVALALLAGAGIAALLLTRSYLLHDEHFVIASPASIQMEGNAHVTRAQMLSVFGEDVERSILNLPLSDRRAELERLPWVEHATVMRLLPNRVRVRIVERTPVAFVRQGAKIGLVDAHGVLLEMPNQGDEDGSHRVEHYSFPVVTGISANDPLSTRAARLTLYMTFISALDAGGEKISAKLSEVDLSDPEDVKALIPDTAASSAAGGHPLDVLVHLGDDKFLDRYKKYQEHLPEWRTQYPKLYAADMRYERQVVLEMQPGSAVPSNGEATTSAADTKPAPPAAKPLAPAPLLARSAAKLKPAPAKKTTPAKPVASTTAPHPAPAPTNTQPVQHLTTSFAVPSSRSAATTTAKPGAPR
jgi:cell division protein FtsQ